MGYTLANSSAKNTIFTAAAVAIGATNQPNLQESTLNGVLDSSIAKANDYGFIAGTPRLIYTGYDDTEILLGAVNTIRDSGSNTLMLSPGADQKSREAIHRLDAVRTRRVKTAIREGQWNSFSGAFTETGGVLVLSGSNDQSAFGQDDEAVVNRATPGAFAYNYHGSGYRQSYPAKTQ